MKAQKAKAKHICTQACPFIAAVFQSSTPFQRDKVSAVECHIWNGVPRFPLFRVAFNTKLMTAEAQPPSVLLRVQRLNSI